MAKGAKQTLLEWVYRREFDRPTRVRDMVVVGANIALKKSMESSELYAEASANAFGNYLLNHQEAEERRGLIRSFKILDSSTTLLSWYGVGDSSPRSHELIRSHARLRHRPAFLRMIDSLDDREYEALSCVVLKIGGANNVFLTPQKNEGGIDFFAVVPAPGYCHLFAGGTHPLRIVGQCKKYKSAVSEALMKEFVETIQVVKYRGQSKVEKLVPSWFHSVRGPIIGLMIADSGFQSGADTKARNHGIITADTLDIAEIAALSKIFPESLPADSRAELCRNQVINLLASYDAPLVTTK